MTKERELLEQAKREAEAAETWADLSNTLFDPFRGLLAMAYPTRKERQVFIKTEEYRKICELIDAVRERTGLVEGATPKKNVRFVV